jgi:cation transporter-like permease
MRIGPRELVLWSFLMASAHGAGLMLVPVLVGLRGEGVSSALAYADHLGHMGHQAPGGNDSLLLALAAVGLHSAAMLAVAGTLAVVVYQKVGLEVLRRAWVNLDLIWVGALVVVGGMALGLGLWPLLAG